MWPLTPCCVFLHSCIAHAFPQFSYFSVKRASSRLSAIKDVPFELLRPRHLVALASARLPVRVSDEFPRDRFVIRSAVASGAPRVASDGSSPGGLSCRFPITSSRSAPVSGSLISRAHRALGSGTSAIAAFRRAARHL